MTAMSRGRTGRPSNVAPESSRRRTSWARSRAIRGRTWRHRQQPGSPRDVLPPDHAHPERVARPDQPALGVVGLDVADHDPLVAERGPAQQLLHRREQRRVAAPVDRQRLLGRRGGGRGEVRRDVAAAERVDGLLGVADQHHRGVAAEGPVEHLPLHRVGVLELVDQHDLPPLPHPLGRRRRRRAGQRVGELAEQVVVGEHAEPSLAAVHLRAHGVRERHPAAGRARAVLGLGLEVRLRVVDDATGDLQRLVVGERRPALVEGEGPQVEVVDDLPHQVVEVLDQPGARVGVAGHAERVEHHRAELVGRRDRRGVEPDQRVDHPPVGQPPLLVVVGEQQVHELGPRDRGPVGGVVAQHPLGLHELGADALAELLAGGAAERDDQHLLEPGDTLDDVPGHERADRPRLARAGTGLEQHGAGRQRVGDGEGPADRVTAGPPSRPRRATAPRPARRTSAGRRRGATPRWPAGRRP